MGMARNARLGEEFHEMLIKSNASVDEAKGYVDAIFDSYTGSVVESLRIDNIYDHISLFTNGYCCVKSIDEFMNSDIALFISKVYGKLTYTQRPRTNFLKVFKDSSGFVISENVFYDRFPSAEYIGSIVPECLDYDTRHDERGGNSPAGRALADVGYIIKYTPLSPATVDAITGSHYIDSDFELETDVVERQTEGKFKSDEPAGLEKQLFQITAEYYNAIMSGKKWHKLEFLNEHAAINKLDVEYLCRDNATLCNTNNSRTCLQRMVNGNSMSRHFDSNTSGVDNYLFNSITWVCQGDYKGRELILGRRDEEDVVAWLNGALDAKGNMEAYGLEPVHYTDTCVLHPESFKTVMVNSFNPVFYHGVNELKGTGAVYTIINDFQPR